LQCVRVSILRAEKENGYADFALILGLVLAWAKGDFLLFTSKIVEHSRHLPLTKCDIGGEFKNQARFEREFAVFQA